MENFKRNFKKEKQRDYNRISLIEMEIKSIKKDMDIIINHIQTEKEENTDLIGFNE